MMHPLGRDPTCQGLSTSALVGIKRPHTNSPFDALPAREYSNVLGNAAMPAMLFHIASSDCTRTKTHLYGLCGCIFLGLHDTMHDKTIKTITEKQ